MSSPRRIPRGTPSKQVTSPTPSGQSDSSRPQDMDVSEMSELAAPLPSSPAVPPSRVSVANFLLKLKLKLCKAKFKKFVETWVDPEPDVDEMISGMDKNAPTYMQRLEEIATLENPFLDVNCGHIQNFDADLYRQLICYPQEVIPTLDMAVNEMFFERFPDTTLTHQIQVRPYSADKTKNMRTLGPEDIDQLISITGMVTRASDLIPEMAEAVFRCSVCRYTVNAELERGRIHEPTLCHHCSTNHSFSLVHNRSRFSDKQMVKLQESPDDMPAGQTPHTVILYVHGELVDAVQPGDRVSVSGVYRAVPVRVSPIVRNIRSVYKTHIDVVHFRKTDATRLQGKEEKREWEPEKIAELEELSKKPDIYERLARDLAPSICENEDVKKGILMQEFVNIMGEEALQTKKKESKISDTEYLKQQDQTKVLDEVEVLENDEETKPKVKLKWSGKVKKNGHRFQMAANTVVQLLWWMSFGLCLGLSISGPFYTIWFIFQLPKSFLVEQLYLAVILAYFFIFLVVSIRLIKYAKKLDNKQKGKPSYRYIGMRMKASRYALMENESGSTWIEEASLLVKKLIASRLDGSEDEQQTFDQVKMMIESFYAEMVFNGDDETREMAKRAISFTIKSQLIKFPSDIQGKRRAHTLLKIISDMTDDSTWRQRLMSCWLFCLLPRKAIRSVLLSCSCCRLITQLILYIWYSILFILYQIVRCILLIPLKTVLRLVSSFVNSTISLFSSRFSSETQKKYSWKSILITAATTLLLTIAPYLADIGTDANLVLTYWNLWRSSPSSLVFLITGHSANDVPGSELFIPVVYLSIFLGLSMIWAACSNITKKVARFYKVELKMENPEVERRGEILSTSSVIQRHDVAVEESGFESPYQSIWQFGIYLSIIPLVHAIPANVFNLVLDEYKMNLKFMPDFLLSGIFTLFSLTMGQVNKNRICEEYNITWKQSIFYTLASFGSTVVFLLVATSTVSSWLGLNYNNDTFGTVGFLIFFTLAILSVGPVVTRIIRFIQHATHFSASALCRALCSTSTASNKLNGRLPAPSMSWVFNSFSTCHLPTSQHITDGCYNFYHSTITQSPQLLFKMAAQCLTYSCFLSGLLWFNSYDFNEWSRMQLNSNYTINATNINNKSIVDMARYELTNRTYILPQSELSDARYFSSLFTLLLIPVGFGLSYLFLYIYFKLDNGFYSNVNMDYRFHNDDEIAEDNREEDVENVGANIELLADSTHDSIAGTGEDPSTVDALKEKDKLDDPEKSSCSDWFQSWIDRDVEDDWYAGRKIKACGKSPAPFKDWDMSGSWSDLTGDDGIEGECEEGAAVANSQEEGTPAYQVKMSFPYFRSEKEKAEVVVETQV